MRRNRAVRNDIEAALGAEAIEELERWNDGRVDMVQDYSIYLSEDEQRIQQLVLENLAGR